MMNSGRDLESEYRDKVDDNMAVGDPARKKLQRSYSNTGGHGHSQSLTRSQQNNSEGASTSHVAGVSRNINDSRIYGE